MFWRKTKGSGVAASEVADAGLNTITIHGKKLVGGLLWEPLESYRNYMAEAKRIGKDRKMEMVAIRKSESAIQAGFAPRTKQRLKGYYSLAATLAGCLGDSWMGAFAVGDGRFVFITVIDGIVLPGQDIIGERDKVMLALQKTYSLVTADKGKAEKLKGKIIAPAEFNFSDDNRSLTEILSSAAFRKEHLLRPLALGLTPREIAMGVGGVAAVGALALGVSLWMDKREEEERQAEALRQASEAEKQRLEARSAVPQPWVDLPNAKLLLEAAASALREMPLNYGGWDFVESACDPAQCAAIYSRPEHGSPIGAFLAASSEVGGARLADNKGVVYSKLDLSVEKGDLLQPIALREYSLVNYFQGFGPYASATLQDAPQPAEDPGNPPPPVTWTKKNFTVSTAFPPERLFDGLDVSGLRVTSVAATVVDGAGAGAQTGGANSNCGDAALCWTIKGEIYGR